MRRPATTLTATACALIAATAIGCGGSDSGISGSQCKLIDCSYDELVCHFYEQPEQADKAYKLFYKRNLKEGGSEYAAILVIDITGLDELSGIEIADTEFAERILLYRPGTGEQWPDFASGRLRLKKGGRAVGETIAGKANFRFENGYLVTIKFDCSLEAPLEEG